MPAGRSPAVAPDVAPGAGRRVLGVVVLAAAALLLLYWRSHRSDAPFTVRQEVRRRLALEVAPRSVVGRAVRVDITSDGEAADGQLASVVFINSYGVRSYEAVFEHGTASLTIPGSHTRQSGGASLRAATEEARGSAEIELTPESAVDPVTPLVGARSIVADAHHWSMCVVVAFDRFGNPVAEGTPVEVRAHHADGVSEMHATEVHHLLAWLRLFSHTRAGRTMVTVNITGRHGPDALLLEIPGWPVDFHVEARTDGMAADGRQFVTLHTDVIRDKFSNVMLDGTLVTFIANTMEGEPRIIPAYTIDGVARALLQAPHFPQLVELRAVLHSSETEPLGIRFGPGPAVNEFPIEVKIDSVGRDIELTAGPLLGSLDQFVPDGTPVRFTMMGPALVPSFVDVVADAGYAKATVRRSSLSSGAYAVEVRLGAGSGATSLTVP